MKKTFCGIHFFWLKEKSPPSHQLILIRLDWRAMMSENVLYLRAPKFGSRIKSEPQLTVDPPTRVSSRLGTLLHSMQYNKQQTNYTSFKTSRSTPLSEVYANKLSSKKIGNRVHACFAAERWHCVAKFNDTYLVHDFTQHAACHPHIVVISLCRQAHTLRGRVACLRCRCPGRVIIRWFC